MALLDCPAAVERALTRYTDPLQPRTSSITALSRSGAGRGDALPPALLDDLEERDELRRRMAWLSPEEAVVLVRWYVEGAKPEVIADGIGRSVRHVYRRRSSALATVVALGCRRAFADADVAEFV